MMIDLNIDEYQCRICLENGMRKEFIAPCKCTGSSKWVHRICLDKWRSVREEKAFHKCTECLTEYIFLPSSKSSHECSQQFQFTCLVCRDLLVFLVVLSCLVGIFALFVFECDYQAQLISSFHMELQPKIFYTLFGLAIILTLVGITGACIYACGGYRSHSDRNTSMGSWLYWDTLMFIPPTESGACCDCCCCCSDGFVCHQCEAGSGGSCTACCHGTSIAGAEDACMLFGLAMVVILAVIGIFICLIAGTYLLNVIMRRHVHVLQKWTRTQQQVVADLAAYKNDNDIEKDINDDENLGPTAPLVQNSHSMYRSLEADKGVYMNV